MLTDAAKITYQDQLFNIPYKYLHTNNVKSLIVVNQNTQICINAILGDSDYNNIDEGYQNNTPYSFVATVRYQLYGWFTKLHNDRGNTMLE